MTSGRLINSTAVKDLRKKDWLVFCHMTSANMGKGITLATGEKVPGRTPVKTLPEGKKLYTDLEEY